MSSQKILRAYYNSVTSVSKAGLVIWRHVGEPKARQTPGEEYAENKTLWEQEKEARKKIKREMAALKKVSMS